MKVPEASPYSLGPTAKSLTPEVDPTMLAMAAAIMDSHGKFDPEGKGRRLAELTQSRDDWVQSMEKKPQAYWNRKFHETQRDREELGINGPHDPRGEPLGPRNEFTPGSGGLLKPWNRRT